METFTVKIDFIRKVFGEISIARDGINIATKCPNCGTKGKRKFSINIENWSCHCWVCGIKGRTPHRILFQHVSEDAAREFKFKFLNNGSSPGIADHQVEEEIKLPNDFIPLCTSLQSRDPDIRDCINYLRKRGISDRDFWYFRLGSVKKGRFRRRVIIPSFDSEGDLNYFSARSIDYNSFKYINSKAKKMEIIFNEINIDWSQEITLVEGPFDLFKCNQNSTCLLGSQLSKRSYLFKRLVANRSPVILGLDFDMREKSAKIADLLCEYGCSVKILPLGGFSDVGEMSRKDFEKLKKESLVWTREASLKEKIASIRTGSLF